MFQQRIDRHLVALRHVEHAVGPARLLEQFGDAQRRAGVDRAGLQDEADAGGDDQVGQFVLVPVEQFEKPEHHAGTTASRHGRR